MRALAITGIETAPMMLSIMSGSLIRETPPWARMSAGTRSRAMTATAPASSAILACSAVTTSMMTPPLSISAMPRLTRVVPVALVPLCWSAAGVLPVDGVVLTMSCFPVFWGWDGAATQGRPTTRECTTGSTSGPTSDGREVLRRLVVELHGVGQGCVAGEVEHPDGPLAAHPAYVGHRVVVETPGELHPRARRVEARQDVLAEDGRAQVVDGLGRQGEVEGLGQVVLGELAGVAVLGRRLERPGRRVGEQE